jgi:UDP-3-O-[3-hydroxymyristoyl] glucosamine N-acyltransferase
VSYLVAELAELLGGTLVGDGSASISSALPFEEATPGSITLIADKKHHDKLAGCNASAVILPKTLVPGHLPAIVVDDPMAAILRVAILLSPRTDGLQSGIDTNASIHSTVKMGKGCSVGAFAVIEAGVVLGDRCVIHPHAVIRSGARLGSDVEIHPHAVIYPRTSIGDRCIIHSGAIIGSDGFGYKTRNGRHEKIPQVGIVDIAADVEIGANSTVDRATFGTTRIGEGTKIDNQVMVGHNCQIGKHNILVSHVGISGSVTTGDYVVLAGKVGIADHVHIGTGAVLGASSGVHADIPAGQVYLGTPARPERETKRLALLMEKLPEMRRQIAELQTHLGLRHQREAG